MKLDGMKLTARKMTRREIIEGNIAAGDTLAVLHSFGWCELEARTKKGRERSAWISPEGKWYNVPFGDHNIFALYVCQELFPKEEMGILDDRGPEVLVKNGWIRIYHDWVSGTIIRGYQHMNKEQYEELLSFFGEERLFRGWTVRAMWLAKEDMKEQSKED
jgi:hypothetical protein